MKKKNIDLTKVIMYVILYSVLIVMTKYIMSYDIYDFLFGLGFVCFFKLKFSYFLAQNSNSTVLYF